MFGVAPMTTEMFIARCALFRRERLAIRNFPRDRWRMCAASSNATSKHTRALAPRAHASNCQVPCILRAAEAKHPTAHQPHFTSPNLCFHGIFMNISSPNLLQGQDESKNLEHAVLVDRFSREPTSDVRTAGSAKTLATILECAFGETRS